MLRLDGAFGEFDECGEGAGSGLRADEILSRCADLVNGRFEAFEVVGVDQGDEFVE